MTLGGKSCCEQQDTLGVWAGIDTSSVFLFHTLWTHCPTTEKNGSTSTVELRQRANKFLNEIRTNFHVISE